MRATFVLSKDPSHESTGDLTMAKLVMEMARESYDIGVICLSQWPQSTEGGFRRVPKTAPRARQLLLDSVRSRRSLVHTRFDLDELVEAVDDTDSDIFVADHCYMAESVLRSRRSRQSGGTSILAVSTVVPEALVWRATRGLAGHLDARRIVRDEVRVARSAFSVGTYDEPEAEFFRDLGVQRAHWLDLTLAPVDRVAVEESERRLVFLGDRRWAPNQEAFETLVRRWPRISEGIDGARLFVVGARDPEARPVELPDGMEDLGFVDDLTAFLASCRALVAPIRTGGGVRVKILDAACRGLPVVGTSAAVGSLSGVLGIDRLDEEQAFIDRCRHYLLDRSAAVADGGALYDVNAQRWKQGKPQEAVQEWLKR
ncbi:MAG: glycosyltransferase [Mycobacterium sp.]